MGTFRLEALFRPRSIAVIGASNKVDSVGGVVIRKLIDGGFAGIITPINPNYETIGKLKCFPTLLQSGQVHDLVVIATPAETVPRLVEDAASSGCQAAIILSAGLGSGPGTFREMALKTALADIWVLRAKREIRRVQC